MAWGRKVVMGAVGRGGEIGCGAETYPTSRHDVVPVLHEQLPRGVVDVLVEEEPHGTAEMWTSSFSASSMA